MRNPLEALFERRSIGTSHDLFNFLARGRESSAGISITEGTAMNVPVILTCVALISRTVMTFPIDVFERMPDGSKKEAPNHPLARLFDKPNTFQDWPTLVQMMQAHLLLRGNAYAWINWTATQQDGERLQATEMIPLHPDRVRVTVKEQGVSPTIEYTLTLRNGTSLNLPADEVMHLRGLSTDGVMGRCPIDDLCDTIGNALARQRHSANFWRRDATPPLAIKHPGKLTPKAKTGLEDSFEATYNNQNGRRVAVLEEGMSIEQLALDAEKSQLIETAKFSRAELAGSFFVPPHMIGDTEKSTSWGTGIAEQKLGYLTFSIQPWLTIWEAGIKRCLITNPRRFYTKFKVEGFLRSDPKARAAFYKEMWSIGAFSINQILALEDMNPVDGGDVRFVPLNFTTLDRAISGEAAKGIGPAHATLMALLSHLEAQKAA